MSKRRRVKQTETFRDRLASFAKEAREKASQLKPGTAQRELLAKARQADIASHMEEWLDSPGLQPPK
jgi:hypothetical protein